MRLGGEFAAPGAVGAAGPGRRSSEGDETQMTRERPAEPPPPGEPWKLSLGKPEKKRFFRKDEIRCPEVVIL